MSRTLYADREGKLYDDQDRTVPTGLRLEATATSDGVVMAVVRDVGTKALGDVLRMFGHTATA
jgi:hypothetical protein